MSLIGIRKAGFSYYRFLRQRRPLLATLAYLYHHPAYDEIISNSLLSNIVLLITGCNLKYFSPLSFFLSSLFVSNVYSLAICLTVSLPLTNLSVFLLIYLSLSYSLCNMMRLRTIVFLSTFWNLTLS